MWAERKSVDKNHYMERYYALFNHLFFTNFEKNEKRSHYFQIVISRYITLMFPVLLISLALFFHQRSIEAYSVGSINYLRFLLISGLVSPCLAQASLFHLLSQIKANGSGQKKRELILAFFDYLPTHILSVTSLVILLVPALAIAMHFDTQANLSLCFLVFLNSIFASFINISGLLKKNYLWILSWVAYIAALFIFPLQWFLPPVLAIMVAVLGLIKTIERPKLGKIRFDALVSQSLFRGLFLALVVWCDKIIIFVLYPAKFNAQYTFIPLIPFILTLNYYFVFIQRPLNNLINTLIWGINNYPIQKYLNYGQLAIKDFHKSILNVFVFYFVCSGLTFFLAEHYLPNKYLMLLNLLLVLLITLMTVLLNIQLYLPKNSVFFVSSLMFITAMTLLVVFSDSPSYTKLIVSLTLFFLGFKLLISDLIRQWQGPHASFLKLT